MSASDAADRPDPPRPTPGPPPDRPRPWEWLDDPPLSPREQRLAGLFTVFERRMGAARRRRPRP